MQIWYIFLCPLWVRYSSKRWFCNLAFSLFYCVLSNGMPWPRFKNIGSQHGSIKYQPLILLTQMRFNNIGQYLVSAIIEKYSCTFGMPFLYQKVHKYFTMIQLISLYWYFIFSQQYMKLYLLVFWTSLKTLSTSYSIFFVKNNFFQLCAMNSTHQVNLKDTDL